MTSAQEFKLKNSTGNVVTDYTKTRGAALGACIRLNVIPTSTTGASMQIQVFPRSLTELTRLCHKNNLPLASPMIPGLHFYPDNRQALEVTAALPDKTNNINAWPVLLFNGTGDLGVFPSVKEMDVNISGEDIFEISSNVSN